MPASSAQTAPTETQSSRSWLLMGSAAARCKRDPLRGQKGGSRCNAHDQSWLERERCSALHGTDTNRY